MSAAKFVDVNPPYLYPAYASTVLRSPAEPLVEAPPEWVAGSPGPDFRRIPVAADGADLLGRHAGEPIGERIIVTGRVVGSDGRPVAGTLVEMWQTNAAGIYEDPSDPGFFPHDPNFVGAGRCLTDADGRFRFRTVRPGAYPQAPGQIYRPAHIHFSVFGTTLGSRLITQCYFEGDPLIGRDPIVHSTPDERGVARLIARLDEEATQSEGRLSALTYTYDIVLRGPGGAGVGPGGAAVGPGGAADGESRPADADAAGGAGDGVINPSQTIGPRFGYALMFDGSQRAAEPGEPGVVEIRGRVLDGAGEVLPYPDAMLELWTGDQFARTRTDADGTYRAWLRKPGQVALPDGRPQAPFVHVTVFARGLLKQAQTRMYFPGDEQANAADPVLGLVPVPRRAALVARAEDGALRFDIRLQGAGETPFFAF